MAGGHREIPLTKGKVALVDAADFEWLSQWKWFAHVTGYCLGNVNVDGVRRTVTMHRMIMEPPPGFEVDHANRDGLDNRRANLRVATRSQNVVNRIVRAGAAGFRGVYIDASHHGARPYRAEISFNGKRARLGRHLTAIEAARAYDRAARQLHGEFAILNFPEAA